MNRDERERDGDTGSRDLSEVSPTRGEEVGTGAAIALNAVPIAGGVMSGIAGEIISRRQNRRLEDFLKSLADDLSALEDRLNTEFLRSEEFQDLAEDAFSRAAETRQKEKLDAFRAIFLNTVLSEAPRYDRAAEMLSLIDGWQARHVVLLKILSDHVRADEELRNPVGDGGGLSTSIQSILQRLLPEWSADEIERTWKDLYDAQIHRTQGTKTMMPDRGIHQLENRLTNFGDRVAQFIQNPRD